MGLVIGSVGLVTDRWGGSLVWSTEWWGGGGLIVLVSGGGIWFDFGFDWRGHKRGVRFSSTYTECGLMGLDHFVRLDVDIIL